MEIVSFQCPVGVCKAENLAQGGQDRRLSGSVRTKQRHQSAIERNGLGPLPEAAKICYGDGCELHVTYYIVFGEFGYD
jgi:hypothetical protein